MTAVVATAVAKLPKIICIHIIQTLTPIQQRFGPAEGKLCVQKGFSLVVRIFQIHETCQEALGCFDILCSHFYFRLGFEMLVYDYGFGLRSQGRGPMTEVGITGHSVVDGGVVGGASLGG